MVIMIPDDRILRRRCAYYAQGQFICMTIPAFFIVALYIWGLTTHWRLFFARWSSLSSNIAVLLVESVFFHFCFVCGLTAYFRTTYTDPGGVPMDTSDVQCAELKGGQARYCKVCKNIKPDRTHHCRLCNTCVLRMDHHCPWVNNCVGFRNAKFFSLFLFHTGCVVLLFDMSAFAYLFSRIDLMAQTSIAAVMDLLGEYELFFQVMAICTLSLFLSFGLLSFAGSTFISAMRNRTPVETLIRGPNTWDVGAKANFRSIFGESPWLWFLPVQTLVGDGLHYPSRKAAQAND